MYTLRSCDCHMNPPLALPFIAIITPKFAQEITFLLYFHPNFKGTTPLHKCTSERRRLCLSYWKCKEKHNVTNVYLLPDYNALMSTQSYGCTEQNDWLVQQTTDETYRWLACVNYYEGERQRAQLTSQLQHRYPTQRSVARV